MVTRGIDEVQVSGLNGKVVPQYRKVGKVL